MHGSRCHWPLAMQQSGHEKRALFRIRVDDVEVIAASIHDICLMGEFRYAVANFVTLSLARERSHIDVFATRIANANFTERRRERLHNITGDGRWCNDAANSRTFLTRLAGHFTSDLFDVEIKFGCAGYRVRAQNR